MVRLELVAAKLAELDDRIDRVRRHRASDPAALASDRDSLDLVSFNLMLAVQSCADLAQHVVSDEGWAPSRTLAETFSVLRDRGVLSTEVAGALSRAVALRNVVAHGYAGVDVAAVHAASTSGLADLERFARELARWAKVRATGE